MRRAALDDTRKLSIPMPVWLALAGLILMGAAAAGAEEPPANSAPETVMAEQAATDDESAPGAVKKEKSKIDSIFDDDDQANGNGKDGGLHWGPFYPSVTVVSSGGGIGPILHLWQRDVAHSGLDLYGAASYSVREYAYYTLKLGRLPRRHSGRPSFPTGSDKFYPLADIERLAGVESRFDIYAGYRYRYYPEEDFFGIGSGSLASDRTDYRLRDHFAEVVTTYHFSPAVALTARAGWLETSLGQGRDDRFPGLTALFDDASAPGLENPPDELILAAGLLADLRDEPGNPHRGALFTVGVSRFEERRGASFDFSRVATDLRFYIPLGSRKHVLATRAIGSFDGPDAGSRIPFYLQSSLGGSQILRGYPGFRFRDHQVIAFSAEYRFEPIPRLELAVFYDAGQVARERSGLSFGDLQTGWGGGVRIKSTRKVLFRFDVAHSREDTRYLIKLGPSF